MVARLYSALLILLHYTILLIAYTAVPVHYDRVVY